MMIFKGKVEAEEVLLGLKRKIKKEKLKPKLAVISVGKDPASELYIKNKKRAAEKIGIELSEHRFKGNAKEKDILQKIEDLNNDRSVSGIIVQLPLPRRLSAEKITNKISPKKDVDGFHKKSHFSPVLPLVISFILRKATKRFKNKRIVALVNSDIFGRTLNKFLGKEKIKLDYILRRKISISKLKSKLQSADVIITVCGVPNLIRGDMIKKGIILIDAGISRLAKGRVVGDVDRESVKEKAAFLTPVPGGTGPLTVAFLLKNVYLAERDEVKRRLKMKANPKGKTSSPSRKAV